MTTIRLRLFLFLALFYLIAGVVAGATLAGTSVANAGPAWRAPAFTNEPHPDLLLESHSFASGYLLAARGIGRHVDDVLKPGGELLGRAGTRDGIRVVQGGAKEAEDTFLRLAEGGLDVTPPGHPGMLVELPGGGFVGYRPVSASGPPTIDVNIPGFAVDKIKYVP